jgi:hypothetical protein
MSTWQPPRRLGAILALLASVLLVLSLVFPLFMATIDVQGTVRMTTTITAWGESNNALSGASMFRSSPAHAFPILFATLLLLVATVIAFVRAGSAAGRSAALWLTMAAAFVAGVAITVVPQLTIWFTMFQRPFGTALGMDAGGSIGLGFWSLAAGAVVAVAAAGVAAMPARKPEVAVVPASPAAEPAGAEPTGAA